MECFFHYADGEFTHFSSEEQARDALADTIQQDQADGEPATGLVCYGLMLAVEDKTEIEGYTYTGQLDLHDFMGRQFSDQSVIALLDVLLRQAITRNLDIPKIPGLRISRLKK